MPNNVSTKETRTLHKLIKSHLRAPGTPIDDFRHKVEQMLSDLRTVQVRGKRGVLQVFDKDKGGVLRGPSASRASLETRREGRILLQCDKEYLEHTADEPSEVAFARAVFNTPDRTVHLAEADQVRLIAYEAPLLRKSENEPTTKIAGNAVRCDLVGVRRNELWAIELKTNAGCAATNPVYGLLEAFAYGILLDQHRRHQSFRNEFSSCVEAFRTTLASDPMMPEGDVLYFVAGPKPYFAAYSESLCETYGRTTGWAQVRRQETMAVEHDIITAAGLPVRFGGYLVLDVAPADVIPMPNPSGQPIVEERDNPKKGPRSLIIPSFKTPTVTAHLYGTLDELMKAL